MQSWFGQGRQASQAESLYSKSVVVASLATRAAGSMISRLNSKSCLLLMAFIHKSSARFSLDLLPGFEFLKIKSVLYDTDNTPKNVTDCNLIEQSRGSERNKRSLRCKDINLF